MLRDGAFRWLAKLSLDPVPLGSGSSDGAASPPIGELARDYLVLPCAIVRGALTHLGVECTVTADASGLPACDFTVSIKGR